VRSLVLVHGRGQENRDGGVLKQDWIRSLREGLQHQGIELDLPDSSVRFPYYGQTLFDLVSGAAEVADVVVRGEPDDAAEREFVSAFLGEVFDKAGITQRQIQEAADDDDVLDRGPMNWGWVRAGLIALDRHVPGASAASVALVTRDVYRYLRSQGVRDAIEGGIRQALTPGEETVVVSHSLGTVVAYNLLRREGQAQGWKVPLLVTLGSPLAVSVIKQTLRPLAHPPVVSRWFNAYDPDDVVSLYGLDAKHFPVDPEVENYNKVQNKTPNQHGISGYLTDPTVARTIYEALTKP
jgi:hypothetical protein